MIKPSAILWAGAAVCLALIAYATYELAWAGPSWRDACMARKGIPIHATGFTGPARICVKRDAIIQVAK